VIGIKGRKRHKKVNPFYRGSAGAKPIMVETAHPTLDCKIFCEMQGGRTAYPAKQIIVCDSNGEYHSILITEKIKNADDLMNELRERGLSNCTGVECWASANEQASMEILCRAVNAGISWSETTPYEANGKKEFVATFTVNTGYFRAIAKIAFHYFLKHFKQFTGFEGEFEGIKEFIMKGGNVDQWVRQVRGSFVWGLGHGVTTDKWCHLIAVDKNKDDIRAKLHFFVGPEARPSQYYEVLIGKNPQRIIYPESIGHQFVYFDHLDKEGYCGRVDPLGIARKELLP
jgi:hypothetical protein